MTRAPEWHRTVAELLEWAMACSALDRAGHALRKEEPPGHDVSVPCVHDRVDLLIEQVAFHDAHPHAAAAVDAGWGPIRSRSTARRSSTTSAAGARLSSMPATTGAYRSYS